MRVLFVHRSLAPPGGGTAVAAWMLHMLAHEHDVTTLTTDPWSPAATNAFYGTSIPDSVKRIVIPPPLRWLSGLPEDRLTRLRLCSVLHYARPIADRFDLLVSGENYAPFPRRGIQYVNYPADLQPAPAKWPVLVNGYFAFCDWLLGGRWADAAQNVTLANSQWTADGLERLGEVSRPIVVYPPVIKPEGLSWSKRDDAFLCIGRFHGSKRIELAIAIVKRVRESVLPSARLLLVGSAVDAHYTKRIRRMALREGDWIDFREDLSRQQLNALMGRTKYGIQAMENEHFGMATAEMTRAGCLVFAHRSGGTPEVLDHENAVLWSSEDEAVARISAIVQGGRGDVLSSRLRVHAEKFSSEAFIERFRRTLKLGL
ncbi:MAG: glycosyltransferase [Acidimicrobiia bacterium]|nr:glycosyltransferase [Acidimicrobiia bacterium]